MNSINRRVFLKTSVMTSGAIAMMSFSGIHRKTSKNKLAFSTLGCPTWDLRQIVDFAAKHQYAGIELRGLNGEIDLRKSPYLTTGLSETKRMLSDRGLKVVNLGSSAQMHHAEATEKQKHLDEAKAYVDLAHKLDCPFVRVFPEKLGDDKEGSKGRIAENLLTLGKHAQGSNVAILLESHGELVYSKDLVDVMTRSAHNNVGLIWDVMNMWAVTGESPAQVYPQLSKFIKHVHLKDGVKSNGKINYVLLGKGDAPVKDAIDQLKKGKYSGYYSFEWEKLWHPEIAEPEVAFAHYSQEIAKYLK